MWPDAEHTFCEIDPFCQQVLLRHWPNSKVYGDIRSITDTRRKSAYNKEDKQKLEGEGGGQSSLEQSRNMGEVDLLTGGFPCQPFSQAGRRGGTADNRYLWPEMLRVIQLTKPTWVIAENVRGLLTIEQGVVFEQVCLDLEASGYEVQPLIIPAVSVNAPHRRDRVWFVAHKLDTGLEGVSDETKRYSRQRNREWGNETSNPNAQDSISQRSGGGMESSGQVLERQSSKIKDAGSSWEENWVEVATRLCRVDDGVPRRVDRLKALGNAIVPQVAIEVMKAIKQTDL